MIKESNYFLLNNDNNLNLKDLDKSHDQIIKNQHNETPTCFSESKINFYKDSFYQSILSNIEYQRNFQNINQNIHFKSSDYSDITHSSLVDYYSILKFLEENNEFKKVEENISNYNLSKYKKDNYSLITKSYRCPDLKSDFKYYRKVKPNGNSFYISFIYQYISDAISKGNETLIMSIINSKTNIFDDINNIDIKLKDTLIYLFMIFRQINEKNLEEANNIFEFAILYKKEFAKYLCNYMRFKIQNFISSNKNKFTFEKYCESNKLINEEYYDIDKQFLDEKYINENVIIDQMEPSLFIISIVPYVFNVSMNLYINEESNNIKPDESLCEKIILNPEKNISINILYSSFSYHIIDMDIRNFDYEDSEDLGNIFNITNNEDLDSNKKQEYILDLKGDCPDCKKKEFIILKNLKDKPICLNCLKNEIDEVLVQRFIFMKKEGFKYIEYYFQEIPLFKKNNELFYLTFPEFYIIFNCNIFSYFRNLAHNICDNCFNFQRKGKFEKQCGCIKCINCVKKELKYIFLTNFEKNYIFKNKFIKCSCGKNINEVELASKIFNLIDRTEKEKLKEDSNKRTKNYVTEYCMRCGKKCETNKCQKYNFNDTKYSEHFVCEECNGNINNNEPISIFCIICDKGHEQNEEKIIDNFDKSNENSNDGNISKDQNDTNLTNEDKNDINNNKNIKKSLKKHCAITINNESNNINCEEPHYNNSNKIKNLNSINQKINNKNNNKINNFNKKRTSNKISQIYQSTPTTNQRTIHLENNEENEIEETKENGKHTKRRRKQETCCINC
jgi:hypothetical protein